MQLMHWMVMKIQMEIKMSINNPMAKELADKIYKGVTEAKAVSAYQRYRYNVQTPSGYFYCCICPVCGRAFLKGDLNFCSSKCEKEYFAMMEEQKHD